jgi:sodium-dependent dicarboxylate transporter 2/3/5
VTALVEEVTPSQRLGFWAGLLAGLGVVLLAGVLPRPDGLSVEAIRLVGVTMWVGIWWISEAIPLGATALIPFATFPLLGIATAKATAPAYASPFILLLLGGFLLALAVERSGVHRRLSLHVLRIVGTSPRRLVLGFAIAAAVMSMWISNTATTLIMMPIGIAIAERAGRDDDPVAQAFTIAVLLGTGYGASIGGMGTPIGTPPNLIAMAAIADKFPGATQLTFVTWAIEALPAVVIIVPIMWLMLTRLYPKVPKDLDLGAAHVIRDELKRLGKWRTPEILSLAVFGVAAILWITRKDFVLGRAEDFAGWDTLVAWLDLGKGRVGVRGWESLFGLVGTHDGTVAILVACIAFALPAGGGSKERLLPWHVAVKVPWGLVLLFGGGVALSKGFDATGLSAYLGATLGRLADASPSVFVGVTALAATFGTEIISNTALANITMPILAETAKAAAMDPTTLVVPVALACSCAFMMPAATGPNAIVFGTGKIRIAQMAKAGFFINWAAWAVIVIIALVL